MIAENPGVASDVDDPRYAVCEGTPEAMARALTNYPRDGLAINGVKYPHAYWEGVAAKYAGDEAKAQSAFTNARTEVAKIVQNQPEFAAALSLLGMIDAGWAGRKRHCVKAGARAICCRFRRTRSMAWLCAVNLAQIYAWTGERDLAIEQIAAVQRVPNYLSYGFLKLQPFWNTLRGDARFEKIVASLAPQTGK